MNDSPSTHELTGPGVPGTTGTPTFIAERCRISFRYACHRIGAYTQCTCFGLVTKTINDFRGGSNERDTSLLDLSRELGVFGQETIATKGFNTDIIRDAVAVTQDGSCRRHVRERF